MHQVCGGDMEATLYRLFLIGVAIGTVLGLCGIGVFLWVE